MLHLFSRASRRLQQSQRAAVQGLVVLRRQARTIALALPLIVSLPAQADVVVMDCDDWPAPAPVVHIVHHAPSRPSRAAEPRHRAVGHHRRNRKHSHYGRHCRMVRRCRRADWAEPGGAPYVEEALGSWVARQDPLQVVDEWPPSVTIPEPPVAALIALGALLVAGKRLRGDARLRRLTRPDRA